MARGHFDQLGADPCALRREPGSLEGLQEAAVEREGEQGRVAEAAGERLGLARRLVPARSGVGAPLHRDRGEQPRAFRPMFGGQDSTGCARRRATMLRGERLVVVASSRWPARRTRRSRRGQRRDRRAPRRTRSPRRGRAAPRPDWPVTASARPRPITASSRRRASAGRRRRPARSYAVDRPPPRSRAASCGLKRSLRLLRRGPGVARGASRRRPPPARSRWWASAATSFGARRLDRLRHGGVPAPPGGRAEGRRRACRAPGCGRTGAAVVLGQEAGEQGALDRRPATVLVTHERGPARRVDVPAESRRPAAAPSASPPAAGPDAAG